MVRTSITGCLMVPAFLSVAAVGQIPPPPPIFKYESSGLEVASRLMDEHSRTHLHNVFVAEIAVDSFVRSPSDPAGKVARRVQLTHLMCTLMIAVREVSEDVAAAEAFAISANNKSVSNHDREHAIGEQEEYLGRARMVYAALPLRVNEYLQDKPI